MDILGGFFDGPRAHGAFALRARMASPWALEVRDEAPLSVVAMVAGQARVRLADASTHVLSTGDVALLRGPDSYVFADDLALDPQAIILPGQRCVSPSGESLSEEMDLGVRTWGNSVTGSTVMLIGSYLGAGEVSRRLTDALPLMAVVRADQVPTSVITLLENEIGTDLPGQEVVLDRLLDLLVVQCLRSWFAQDEARRPPWARAGDDRVVAQALALLHDRPEHPWRLAELAADVGLSRAALARRFHAVVGEPPMAYLASWRLALAADLLHDPRSTVTSVARQVGYASPFTFSAAFKKAYGHSPREHHDHVASDPARLPS